MVRRQCCCWTALTGFLDLLCAVKKIFTKMTNNASIEFGEHQIMTTNHCSRAREYFVAAGCRAASVSFINGGSETTMSFQCGTILIHLSINHSQRPHPPTQKSNTADIAPHVPAAAIELPGSVRKGYAAQFHFAVIANLRATRRRDKILYKSRWKQLQASARTTRSTKEQANEFPACHTLLKFFNDLFSRKGVNEKREVTTGQFKVHRNLIFAVASHW